MAVFQQHLTAIIGADVSGFNSAMTKMQGKMKSMRSDFNRWLKYGMAAAVGVGAASIKMAMTFDKAFARTAAIAKRSFGATSEEIEQMREGLIQISEETGVDVIKILAAHYETLSRSGKVLNKEQDKMAAALGLTRVAIDTGIVGFANYETVIQGMMAGLSIWGEGVEEATRYVDVFTKTVDLGGLILDEFVKDMPRVGPIAAQLGLSVEDVAAAFVTLTRAGIQSNEAASGLRMALMGILKPSTEALEISKALEIEWNKKGLEKHIKAGTGWAGMLAEASERLEAMDLDLSKLSPRVRAFLANLILAKNGGADFRDALEGIGTAEGVVAEGLEDLMGTQFRQYEIAINSMKLAMIDLGEALLPVFVDLVKILKNEVVPAIKWVIEFVEKAIKAIEELRKGAAPGETYTVMKAFGATEEEAQMAMLEAGKRWTEGAARERIERKIAELEEKVRREEIVSETKKEQAREAWAKMDRGVPGSSVEALTSGAEELEEGFTDVKDITEQLNETLPALSDNLRELSEETESFFSRIASAADKVVGRTGFQHGGRVGGVGFSDSVPALLAPGEFVVRKQAAALWSPFLQDINAGQEPEGMAFGGMMRGRRARAGRLKAPFEERVGLGSTGNTFNFNQPIDRHTIRGLIIPEIERSERLRRMRGRREAVLRRHRCR